MKFRNILKLHTTHTAPRDDHTLGMKSDTIALGQLVASSYTTIFGIARIADYSRLDNPDKWCPDLVADSEPWLQVTI